MKSFLPAGVAIIALLGLSQSALSSPPATAPAPATKPEDCDKAPRRAMLEQQAITATPRTDAPALGRADSKVTLEVWSDFECSFCARGAETVKELRAKYGEQVRIVFRQNPLPRHEHARLAAIASMAAHEQGRFWEYHDALFTHQDALDRASLVKLAKDLKLDVERFQRALDSSTWSNYLDTELAESQRRRIGATPTYFINGKPLMGARSLEVFAQVIDEALAR